MTGVRALAALWVVVYHLRDVIETLLPASRVVRPWMENGYLGVDVFFVLSGFIISHNYAEKLASLKRRSYRSFAIARFARIYPTHVVALLVTAGLVGYAAIHSTTLDPAQHYTVTTFVGNLFMLQALPGLDPWNIPSWSVSCEVAAYLVFPLVAGRLLRIGRATSWGLIGAFMVAEVGVLIASSTTPLYLVALYWARIIGEFSVGCLSWSLWRRSTRPRRRWDVVAVASICAVAIILECGASGAFGLAFLAVPFVALFVVSIPSASGPVRSILSSPVLQWGGRISYSVYLIHTPVMVAMFILHRPLWFAASSLAVRSTLVLAYFVVLIGAGAATYYLVEEPARKLLRRVAASRPPIPSASRSGIDDTSRGIDTALVPGE